MVTTHSPAAPLERLTANIPTMTVSSLKDADDVPGTHKASAGRG